MFVFFFQNRQERRIFSAAPAKEGIGGLIELGRSLLQLLAHLRQNGCRFRNRLLMAIKRLTAIMRFGTRKVQAELSRIVVILDYLSAVRFAVDRTDELVLINRNQYRTRFPANLIRRRYAIDFAQRRRIRCSQRFNVRMIARGLNVDIQRLTRAQIRHLTMGIALQTERVHPRLVGKPVVQIIERIVVRRGRAARTGIRLLVKSEKMIVV